MQLSEINRKQTQKGKKMPLVVVFGFELKFKSASANLQLHWHLCYSISSFMVSGSDIIISYCELKVINFTVRI